jgi:hypothetical protein
MATLTAIAQTVGWLAYPLDELLPDYDPLFPASATRASYCPVRRFVVRARSR